MDNKEAVQKMANALNCVAKHDCFAAQMGRIKMHQLERSDGSRDLTMDEAMSVLETRIKVQRIQLQQAEEALLELREAVYEEARESLARVMF